MCITDKICLETQYFTLVMKDGLHSVALALAVLLAVQPALTKTVCIQKVCSAVHASTSCCPRTGVGSMQGMSRDLRMPSTINPRPTEIVSGRPLPRSSCGTGPCCSDSFHITVQATVPAKSGTQSKISSFLVADFVSIAIFDKGVLTSTEAVAPVPARSLFFRTLRI